ncbi:MAG TPA: peptidoglycan-binding protein [Bacillales bacterium]|nr:peptidoglycan-binding protein [Bacillales bacterium]
MKFYSKLKALLIFTAVAGIMFATPFTANAETGNNLLQRGMIDPDVKVLQNQLKEFRYYDYKVDSIFGPITFQAVKEFQKDYGLRVDGVAGPNTYDALERVVALKHTYEKAPLLNRGDHGAIVKDLQTQLRDLNYYHGEIDGHYGPLTEEAIRDFQRANEIAVDGIAGPVTYSALIHNPVRAVIREKTTAKDEAPEKKVKSVSTSKASEPEKEKTADVDRNTDDKSVRTFYVESTAYTAYCPGCSGITATGINLIKNPDAKVIAVDPDVIPLGSTVWVEGYGYAVAGDTGGAIDGKKIDVFIPSHSDAMHWGRRTVKIKVFE